MSEEKKPEDVVGVIREDAIVNIPMSTGYYKRIQGLLNAHLEGRSKEDFEKAHTAIKEQNITEGWIFHYETLLILCNEFEKTAKAHNFIDEIPLSEYQKTVEEKLKELESKEDDEDATDVTPA